jgi:hypothetical protein
MLLKIVSGGQTGVDRGALDAALERGFACGGWCPRERRAEDGRIPMRYPLRELDSGKYLDRTHRNVADADGTLILSPGTLTGGTNATAQFARKIGKPLLAIDFHGAKADTTVAQIGEWIATGRIEILNVAGPRESSIPGVQHETSRLIRAVLDGLSPRSPS